MIALAVFSSISIAMGVGSNEIGDIARESVTSLGLWFWFTIMRAKKLTSYVKLIGHTQSQSKRKKQRKCQGIVRSNAYDKIKRLHIVSPHLLF